MDRTCYRESKRALDAASFSSLCFLRRVSMDKGSERDAMGAREEAEIPFLETFWNGHAVSPTRGHARAGLNTGQAQCRRASAHR